MKKNGQLEILNKNFDELDDEKKDTLLEVGEKLLNIQNLIRNEVIEKTKVENE